MAWQSFRGAGGAGAISVPAAEQRGLDRYGELDTPPADTLIGVLRELVTELGAGVETAVARGGRLTLE